MSDKKKTVVIAGAPGNMAMNVFSKLYDRTDFSLSMKALTGPDVDVDSWGLATLIHPREHESYLMALREYGRDVVVIDYTHPAAVNENAKRYCKLGIPFLMGTTGGDRKELFETVKNSNVSAVISINMSPQVVGFLAMFKYAAETLPGLFKGFSLEIIESHQDGKLDTSGTAKEMVEYFNALGIPFKEDRIVKLRDPIGQKLYGIPEEHLGGHGYHVYRLKSADGTVLFEFKHNINARATYVDGSVNGLEFLSKKIDEGSKGEVFSMIDVLKE